MLQRKNLGLDLPAALGKHVLGGSRQVGMSATQAFVPCNFPPQPPDQICGTAHAVSLFLAWAGTLESVCPILQQVQRVLFPSPIYSSPGGIF